MRLKWRFFKQNRAPPSTSDSGGDGSRKVVATDLQRNSTAGWTVKTESFNEFLMELHKLEGIVTDGDGNEAISQSPSFPSLRLIVEHLIKPDQATVQEVLQGSNKHEESDVVELATDYFDSSHSAYRLCATLLRSIKEARHDCKSMKEALASIPEELGDGNHVRVMERMRDLAESRNPFSDLTAELFPVVGESYGVLSSKVEREREAIGKRIRVVQRWRRGAVVMAVGVVGASVIAVVVGMHAVAGLAAAPAVVAAGRQRKGVAGGRYCRKLRMGGLKREGARLEAVARGTFTVKTMLETICYFVARVYDDVEDSRRKVRFGLCHKEEVVCVEQVAENLVKSHERLTQRLSELEEHVVYCCLLINRARGWIVQAFSPHLVT